MGLRDRARSAFLSIGIATNPHQVRQYRGVDILSGQAERALGAQRIWASWAWMLVLLAVVHLTAAGLDLANRAAFQGIPETLIADLSDSNWWIALNAAVAVLLIVAAGMERMSLRSWACNLSSALLISWSGLLLIAGLSVERGVSLLGPTFGILFSVVAQVCAQKFYAQNIIQEAADQARQASTDIEE